LALGCSLDEQAHGFGLADLLEYGLCPKRWRRERMDPPGCLPGNAEGLPTGRQNAQTRTVQQQARYKSGAGLEHVLAIVQNQQKLTRSQRILQGLDERLAGLLLHIESRGDSLSYERRGRNRSELDKGHSSAVPTPVRTCNLECQARFADSARPGEREKSGCSEQSCESA
jgi:hypothetical protein